MKTSDCLNHPGIRALLNALVDRLDRFDMLNKESSRAVKLDSKTFPALFKASLEAEKEQLWECVETLAQSGWIRLQMDPGYPRQVGYERRPRVTVTAEAEIRQALNRLNRVKAPLELWREAVAVSLAAPAEIKELVSRFRIDIPGRTAMEIVAQLNRLGGLREEPLLLREVSAQLFWGGSKHLDARQEMVAALLDVEICPFPEMPVQLQTFLPMGDFAGVLFIENQANFDQAIRNQPEKFKNLALVFAAGFRGSAKRIRSEAGATVFFAETGELGAEARAEFLAWLREGKELPCWFWGDLDHAGMEILRALRKVFPSLTAWEPGYAPMLRELAEGGGHAPCETGKSGQRLVERTGCAYADHSLIPALKATGRFVDQEVARDAA